jgi:hypothetical protein
MGRPTDARWRTSPTSVWETVSAASTTPPPSSSFPPQPSLLPSQHDKRGQRRLAVAFGLVSVIFIYTTIANIIERPDGVNIATVYIGAMLAVSIASRFARSIELCVTDVTFELPRPGVLPTFKC